MSKDVYYNPEHFNLEIVEETDEPNMSYEFHMVVLWKHKETGKMYWAQDSGCSCPSPFEDYNSIEQLEDYDLTKAEYEAAKKACLEAKY